MGNRQEAGLWRARFDFLVGLCLLVASGVVVVSNFRRSPATPDAIFDARLRAFMKNPMPLDPAKTIGSVTSPVVMVGFIDFECPACIEFERSVLPLLLREYVSGGKARFAFRHLPIESLHKTAMGAAVASECAAGQGAFWPFHDGLILPNSSTERTAAGYTGLARKIGINVVDFTQCQTGWGQDRVRAEMDQLSNVGLLTTPLFFFGRATTEREMRPERAIVGTRSVEEFRRTLEALNR